LFLPPLISSELKKSGAKVFLIEENIDYTNEEQIKLFEDYLHLFLSIPSTEKASNKIKGKYMHHYFEALENFNLNK
jgi:hypothetical protein